MLVVFVDRLNLSIQQVALLRRKALSNVRLKNCMESASGTRIGRHSLELELIQKGAIASVHEFKEQMFFFILMLKSPRKKKWFC